MPTAKIRAAAIMSRWCFLTPKMFRSLSRMYKESRILLVQFETRTCIASLRIHL